MSDVDETLQAFGVYKSDPKRRCYYCESQLNNRDCGGCRAHNKFKEEKYERE